MSSSIQDSEWASNFSKIKDILIRYHCSRTIMLEERLDPVWAGEPLAGRDEDQYLDEDERETHRLAIENLKKELPLDTDDLKRSSGLQNIGVHRKLGFDLEKLQRARSESHKFLVIELERLHEYSALLTIHCQKALRSEAIRRVCLITLFIGIIGLVINHYSPALRSHTRSFIAFLLLFPYLVCLIWVLVELLFLRKLRKCVRVLQELSSRFTEDSSLKMKSVEWWEIRRVETQVKKILDDASEFEKRYAGRVWVFWRSGRGGDRVADSTV